MSEKKQVIFCTYSSIYSSKVLEQLIVDDEIELVAIINSTRVLRPSYNHFQGALQQIKTSGLAYSSYLFLVTDFFKWIQPLLVFKKSPLRNVHAFAEQNQLPLLDTRDVNDKQSVDFIKEHMPNYLLAAHFNQLIKKPILELAKIQCINIHPSLLPAYKGVDPVFFALQDSKKTIGVSLHRMSETFDSGEMLMQVSETTDSSKSLLLNNCKLFEEGAKIALKWMKNSNHKPAILDVGDSSVNSYDSWPTAIQVKEFRKSGKRLLHLSELWKQ